MKWKRGQGYDQIEDRRGQAGSAPTSAACRRRPRRDHGSQGRRRRRRADHRRRLHSPFSGVLGGSGGLSGLSGLGAGAAAGGTLKPQSDTDSFVAYIVDDVQDFWAPTFSQSGRDYPETKLVLFDGSTSSGCGPASAATGPFYCPADQKVYLDLGFFDELKSRFGAPGDFAMAYVIAHEFGHHIQTATGVSDAVQQMVAAGRIRRNELSVKQELQADCLAGVWAHSAITELEAGDIEEALTAAAAVGDDRIQQYVPVASTRSPGPTAPRSNVRPGSLPATGAAMSPTATRSAPADRRGRIAAGRDRPDDHPLDARRHRIRLAHHPERGQRGRAGWRGSG